MPSPLLVVIIGRTCTRCPKPFTSVWPFSSKYDVCPCVSVTLGPVLSALPLTSRKLSYAWHGALGLLEMPSTFKRTVLQACAFPSHFCASMRVRSQCVITGMLQQLQVRIVSNCLILLK